MAKVDPPIRLTVVRKVALRPIRSPIAPKMIAPSGRKAKPTANSARAAISAAVGSSPARKTLAMTGVSEPKMKKSYHSNAVPADEAMTTRVIDQGLSCCGAAALAIAFSPEPRDSSAARSVQLADAAVDAGEAEAEALDRDKVSERPAVGLEVERLVDPEAPFHRVADA